MVFIKLRCYFVCPNLIRFGYLDELLHVLSLDYIHFSDTDMHSTVDADLIYNCANLILHKKHHKPDFLQFPVS